MLLDSPKDIFCAFSIQEKKERGGVGGSWRKKLCSFDLPALVIFAGCMLFLLGKPQQMIGRAFLKQLHRDGRMHITSKPLYERNMLCGLQSLSNSFGV